MKAISKLEAFRESLKVHPIIIIEDNEKQQIAQNKEFKEKGMSFDEWEAWTAWNAWEAWTAWNAWEALRDNADEHEER